MKSLKLIIIFSFFFLIIIIFSALSYQFSKQSYSVATIVSGQGSVIKSPRQAIYPYLSTVQLTATPAEGWNFAGWSGDLAGRTNPVTITVNGNKVVTATFTQNSYNLTISVLGSGSTNISKGVNTFSSNSTIQVTAFPSSGWLFDRWILDNLSTNNTNPITVIMNSNRSLEANFIELAPSGVYHAALVANTTGWENQSTNNRRKDINAFVSLTGKKIYAFSSWMADWKGDMAWLLAPGDHSILPLVQNGTIQAITGTWMPYQSQYDTQTLENIANGVDDSYIRTIANECKAFSYPIYMRFGAEFNICQGTGAGDSTWASNPTDFVNAWKRIVNIFRAQGATNVRWVWNPNYSDLSIAKHYLTEYYPGDSYVDWVGIDMYQDNNQADPDIQMTEIYNLYASTKPIAIMEWGTNSYYWSHVNTTDIIRATYLEKFFDAVEMRPQIKMIQYWYYDGFKFDDSNTPLTSAYYKLRVSNPLYISK